VGELREVGLEIESIYDLVNTRAPYWEAIPKLIEILPGVREPVIKEGVVRALAVKRAATRKAIPLLIREFAAIPPDAPPIIDGLKWAIGNTLCVLVDDREFDEIAALVTDKRHGTARRMLVYALGNMKKTPAAVDLAIDLLNDDVVVGHAVEALGRLKAKKAEAVLETLADYPRAWVRYSVQVALRKIRRA